MILDTTFLIDLLQNQVEATEKLKLLQAKNIPISITTPSIVEIWTGLHYTKKTETEKKKILDVLESQIVHNLDKESAEKAGEINGSLIKKGEQIEIIDSMIAGIASKNNEPVLTRNIKHFGKIKEIKVETY